MIQHKNTDLLQTRKTVASDFDFIYRLHQLTLFDYIEQTWGHQEDFQRNGMQEDFNASLFEIISTQEKDIGVISIIDHKNAFFINYLAILPDFQRRGLGRQMLHTVMNRAAKQNIPVKLHVIRINPAKAFYEKLGFQVVGNDKYSFFMEWQK
jgi:ribosomal protein S18 acetylase RimI-like enzyme